MPVKKHTVEQIIAEQALDFSMLNDLQRGKCKARCAVVRLSSTQSRFNGVRLG